MTTMAATSTHDSGRRKRQATPTGNSSNCGINGGNGDSDGIKVVMAGRAEMAGRAATAMAAMKVMAAKASTQQRCCQSKCVAAAKLLTE